ncbi:dihydrofolate reductase [Devosia ginsengisoli]|uniref:dihydrofolate reductase n=2 Tax=Devosia ginsengisoli TaxID=400770 RepID=A0A5B8LRI2_9HYPH|nr:dihydrofolate reductase [Devosia ginsengisoli]
MPTPPRVKMPSATSIVARSHPDHIIGVDNTLPWHLRTDLQHFKKLTAGHAVIMGRRTFESLGRPLPNRLNIVLSRQIFDDCANVKWAKDPETALLLADVHSIFTLQPEFFIIGGEVIFGEFQKYINQFWLTDVYTGHMNGDAKFDYTFLPSEWRTREEREFPSGEHDDFSFRITHYARRKFEHRMRSKEEFMPTSSHIIDRLEEWSEFIESQPADDDALADHPTLF